jgi:hypothetical protein
MGVINIMNATQNPLYRILVIKLEEKIHLDDLSGDGRLIIKGVLREQNGRMCTQLIWLKAETSGELL